MSNVEETLTRFVSQELLGEAEPIAAGENLLADGMVDSVGVMRLVAFIDAEFDYQVPHADLKIANFQSLRALTTYLERNINGGGE